MNPDNVTHPQNLNISNYILGFMVNVMFHLTQDEMLSFRAMGNTWFKQGLIEKPTNYAIAKRAVLTSIEAYNRMKP